MKNGLSPDDMPTYSNDDSNTPCKICGGPALCGGLGVIRYNAPVGDPRFGKLFRCPHNVLEHDVERLNRLRKLSNLGAYHEKSFANFETDSPAFAANERQSLHMAFDLALKYAQNPEGWLLLEGTYGCGKTHLAAAIANERLRLGDLVLFITSPDLLDHLRAAYAPSSDVTYDETFDRIRNAPILVLDDLGVENPSPWAHEKLFQLLNHRYNYNLPTIITTNTSIDKLDPRLRSRLLDTERTHRVMITASDYRTQRKDERLQLASSLPLYTNMTFETFDTQQNATPDETANLQRALHVARSYAQSPNGHWLLLIGGYGVGKTHLAAAVANYRRAMSAGSEEVMFITTPDLMDYLKTAFGSDAGVSLNQRFQQVKDVPLLVLDDLGAEYSTGWAKEKLFQLLDYRYVTRKATVITTAKDIEKLEERLLTRLLDKRLCLRFEIMARSYVMRLR